MRTHSTRGFTLIELLVVISIIGTLATLSVVSLSSARVKARDARRAGDVKQFATALELYNNDFQGFPVGTFTLGSTGAHCLGQNGFEDTSCSGPYMLFIPSSPTPGGAPYTYESADGSTYLLTFELEGQTGELGAGTHAVSEGGIIW